MMRAGQVQVTMTAAQPDIPATEGIRSLEVRWIFSGQLETAVAGGFARFPAELETRGDFGSPSHGGRDPAGWRLIRKTRRISRFSLASDPIRVRGQRPGEEAGCAAELTEVLTRGEAWWTLGFESVGPPHLLRSQLEATAALVFAETLPGEVEPCMNDSKSYAEWLLQWPGAGDNSWA
jgi:hypothetical protein